MRVESHPGLAALLAFAVSFGVLVANGRAIGSGDSNAVELTAAALVEHTTFVLTDRADGDPFTRAVSGGRISVYPPLTALIATPFFVIFGWFFDLNGASVQIVGKLTAAFLSAASIAIMTMAFTRRVGSPMAIGAALVYGLGTSVYSTSQALWQHPAVVLWLAMAISALDLLAITPAASQRAPVGVAAICLAFSAMARPATIPMCAVLFSFLLFRTRKVVWPLIAAALPLAATSIYNTVFFGAPWRFGPELGGRFLLAVPESIIGLLVSPARGLLVFTPIALIALFSLAKEARRSSLARALLASVAAHFAFIAAWNEWHGGESFGPRLLTDMLPALFFFLPEGLSTWPKLSGLLGAASIAIQLLGGWTYDYRWERLHQRGRDFDSALWEWRESPIAFAMREGVFIQGAPEADGRRLRVPVRRFVPFGPTGSLIEGTSGGLRISGDPRVGDLRLERGARLSEGWITLSHPGDALAFRVLSSGVHELRLAGSLKGTLGIELGRPAIRTELTGAFEVSFPIQPGAGVDVFVRAESGELRLARAEVK